MSEQPVSEPELVSQGGLGEGEVQVGGEPEPGSEQLDAAVDNGLDQVSTILLCILMF